MNSFEELEGAVKELNSWNGSLEHLDAYENDDDFFNTFYYDRPMEAVRASYYGEYEYMDDYVRINAYGNLERLSEYQYKEELKSEIDEIIDLLIENKSNLDLDGELKGLLNAIESSN